ALGLADVADEVVDAGGPFRDRAVHPRVEALRDAEAGGTALRGDESRASRGLLPAHAGPRDGLDGLLADQQTDTLLDRELEGLGGVPPAGHGGGDPVPQTRDSGFEAAEELPRAHEVLPAGQHLAAQHA